MSQTLGKWGNSLGYRVPKAYAEQLHWNETTEVDAQVVDGKLVLRAVDTEDIPVYDLEELLVGVTPELVQGDINTGHAVGNEVW
ncbi:MAG TPA: AbrB/MazE/SpoVT family DNA-binding domain-containing protein [Chloroflexia bacterium]|jgi:antitoxin MazE|nr:AbrB/MazE/SpoVT family DNA-binding domain-containing protein [Chloroflexia bacterium]